MENTLASLRVSPPSPAVQHDLGKPLLWALGLALHGVESGNTKSIESKPKFPLKHVQEELNRGACEHLGPG